MVGFGPQTIVLGAVALYGLPALVAVALGRRRQWEIVALDLLLGWTGIGWVAAMVWACRKSRPPKIRPVVPEPDAANAEGADELAAAETAPPEELPPLDPYADWLNQGGGLEASPDGAEPVAAPARSALPAPGSAAA